MKQIPYSKEEDKIIMTEIRKNACKSTAFRMASEKLYRSPDSVKRRYYKHLKSNETFFSVGLEDKSREKKELLKFIVQIIKKIINYVRNSKNSK